MRIDTLTIRNFKKFTEQEFDFHRQFTLLVGENGAGKTSVLDALAVAAGIWLVNPPDSMLNNSRRGILPTEIRLEGNRKGDRIQFRECQPVVISASGKIGDHDGITWTRQIKQGGKQTNNTDAKEALDCVRRTYERDQAGEDVLCPVLAYYGAGRAWLPSNERAPKAKDNGPARRWAAFYDCFNERIRFAELHRWFKRETIERGNRGGRWRPGFEAVRRAVLNCVQGADDLWFDTDRDQIVLSIAGNSQPFDNLSAGQRMMLTLVADIAIKAVIQNAFLLPLDQLESSDESLPRVLKESPGLVLIDELDVHLHPKWQRHVIEDLRKTFPEIQFICTTHSPFLIQSLRSGEELVILDGQPTAQLGDLSVEEIVRGIQGVSNPNVSDRYGKMKNIARHYLETLEEAAEAPEEKLRQYEDKLAESIAPYADNPAFQAFLEMKRAAKLGK